MELKDNIETLNNIGTQRAQKLHKLNIYKVLDLLEYFPRTYNDRSNISYIKDLEIDKENTFIATIAAKGENMRINDKILTKIKLKDSTGTITATWYNQSYLKNNFDVGSQYLFTGKVVSRYNKLEINSPEYEKLDNKELLSGGRIVPVYSSTYKLSQKMLRQLIKNVVDITHNKIDEFMPIYICKNYNLVSRDFAIKNIHFPTDEQSFFKSRYRLVFEEFFLLQLGVMHIKIANSKYKEGIIVNDVEEQQLLINSLPFKLTNSQFNAINEIKNDIKSGKPMNRLIQGDVGSGKTIVALLTAFLVVKNGYQVAMLAPTEILAQQHYESFKNYLNNFNINIGILTGSATKKQKNIIVEQLQNGDIDIIIGTHSLIQEDVIYKNLGLVITDEQHRFGVLQRTALSDKGKNPHILVMTATPIPRTLALILYGDLDITTINELPPNRQTIETFVLNTSYRERVYNFIKQQILEGHQIYIVCPMVDETEQTKDLQSVKEYTHNLKNNIFKLFSIEYIHGKMKPKEKQEIMDKYISGEIDILVSTTVIEVGINVPNSTVMLIENCERFGLAQLHQLRGRVGRGNFKSYCILITDSKSKLTAERLKIMKKSNDGFELSQVDLNLRGPGDFFGTKQHGLPELKIANLYKDINILKAAQQAVKAVLEFDFELENEQNLSLKNKLSEFFNNENILAL